MFWLRPGASVRRLVFTGKYPEAAAELRIAELNEEKKHSASCWSAGWTWTDINCERKNITRYNI